MLSLIPGTVHANTTVNDNDGDGVPNARDQCPNLLEDYDPQYGEILMDALQTLCRGMMPITTESRII